MAWKHIRINYNTLVSAQIDTIGAYMEQIITSWENHVQAYPQPHPPAPTVRDENGEYIISTIVEASVTTLAREMATFDTRTWEKYLDRYLDIRQIADQETYHAGEKKVHLSEASLDAIAAIADYAKRQDVLPIKHLYPAPRKMVNQKLIISVALQSAAEAARQASP